MVEGNIRQLRAHDRIVVADPTVFLQYRLGSASWIPRTAEGAGPFGNKMVKPAQSSPQ